MSLFEDKRVNLHVNKCILVMYKVPSHQELQKIVELIRSIIFPEYYPAMTQPEPLLNALLLIQLSTVLDSTDEAKKVAKQFCDNAQRPSSEE